MGGGQIGYQIGWNLKVSLSGKREGVGQIGVLEFYIQRICTRTEEGLGPKNPLSSTLSPPHLPDSHHHLTDSVLLILLKPTTFPKRP